MNFKALMGSANYTIQKHLPAILLGVGLTGIGVGTVMACQATLKAQTVLATYGKQSGSIDDCVTLRETSEVDYTPKDEAEDRRTLMLVTSGKMLRLYGPSATLMIFSAFCILRSYRIMSSRNVALMGAYKILEEAFGKYRRNVIEEFGEDADTRLRYGTRLSEDGATRTITNADGSETKLIHVDYNLSGFSRSFHPDAPDQVGGWTGSTQWSKVHDYNIDFLNSKEEHFNNALISKGFITVNEVFAELGFPSTEAGMICGWRAKSERGDGYISFRPRGIDGGWVYGQNGDEIILDFNIDGVIFDETVAKKELKKQILKGEQMGLLFDFVMTMLTGGLWLVWILIRYLRKNS